MVPDCPSETPPARRTPTSRTVRAVRERHPSKYVRSPFLPNEPFRRLNSKLHKFWAYCTTDDRLAEKRNVEIGLVVGPTWFAHFMDVKQAMENMEIDAYLCILQSHPEVLGIQGDFKARYQIEDTRFWIATQAIWEERHSGETEVQKYMPNVREDFSLSNLGGLIGYVLSTKLWWLDVKAWAELTHGVITVVNLNGHWVACLIDIKNCFITLTDNMRHVYTKEIKQLQ